MSQVFEREMLEAAKGELQRREIEESAEFLSGSLVDFIREAWHTIKPDEPYQHNWHIEVICDKLSAVSAGEITRLQIWIPPGMMKSGCVSVFWHPWEWTTRPSLRYWGASYETRLAGRLSAMSRTVIESDWYQERWGHMFKLIREAEYYWANDRGGTRLATAPESTGSGEHGHRILIDDPINAKAADATSKSTLNDTNEWYDGTVVSRGIAADHARVLIMQRLHEQDLAAHVLELEEWEVLCLPERYERKHPFVWPGDKRKEGEYLWPSYRPPEASEAMARSLRHRAAGQLQQRPAPKEGQILKRNWWRFYDPKVLDDPKRRPKFQAIVHSIDAPQKDRQHSDNCSIQCWGVKGGDRWLLDVRTDRMSYSTAKRSIIEQARWARKIWPRCRHYVLIENAGYGVELILDLKRELTGVTKLSHSGEGDKVMRAEAASDALEFGNCFLPGAKESSDELSMPDYKQCPSSTIEFIESCAVFPNGEHDDDVDAWSQCMNWLRSRVISRGRTASAFGRRQRAAA